MTIDVVKGITEERRELDSAVDNELKKLIDSTILDLSIDIPEPQVLVSREGRPVLTRGNISMVVGLPGARKSFLCTGIAGAFLSNDTCIGLQGEIPDGNLLWLDTEQADVHVARIGRRLNRIMRHDEKDNPQNIKIHRGRELTPQDRAKLLNATIALYRPDVVVIDGVADLISDPNDVAQSTAIVNELMKLSKEHDCHILVVVHANIGSEKARGHLGSEVQRKAETVITVKADGETSKCMFAKTRDIRPSDFSFGVEFGLPVASDGVVDDSLRTVMEDIIGDAEVSYNQLDSDLQSKLGIKKTASQKRIADAIRQGIIIKRDRLYRIATKKREETDFLPF